MKSIKLVNNWGKQQPGFYWHYNSVILHSMQGSELKGSVFWSKVQGSAECYIIAMFHFTKWLWKGIPTHHLLFQNKNIFVTIRYFCLFLFTNSPLLLHIKELSLNIFHQMTLEHWKSHISTLLLICRKGMLLDSIKYTEFIPPSSDLIIVTLCLSFLFGDKKENAFKMFIYLVFYIKTKINQLYFVVVFWYSTLKQKSNHQKNTNRQITWLTEKLLNALGKAIHAIVAQTKGFIYLVPIPALSDAQC